MLYTCILVY